MDSRVFGVLKRKQGQLYADRMGECPGSTWTKAAAAQTIFQAWEQIDERVVKSARRCVPPAEGMSNECAFSLRSIHKRG
jgi:hypothetical protein